MANDLPVSEIEFYFILPLEFPVLIDNTGMGGNLSIEDNSTSFSSKQFSLWKYFVNPKLKFYLRAVSAFSKGGVFLGSFLPQMPYWRRSLLCSQCQGKALVHMLSSGSSLAWKKSLVISLGQHPGVPWHVANSSV